MNPEWEGHSAHHHRAVSQGSTEGGNLSHQDAARPYITGYVTSYHGYQNSSASSDTHSGEVVVKCPLALSYESNSSSALFCSVGWLLSGSQARTSTKGSRRSEAWHPHLGKVSREVDGRGIVPQSSDPPEAFLLHLLGFSPQVLFLRNREFCRGLWWGRCLLNWFYFLQTLKNLMEPAFLLSKIIFYTEKHSRRKKSKFKSVYICRFTLHNVCLTDMEEGFWDHF